MMLKKYYLLLLQILQSIWNANENLSKENTKDQLIIFSYIPFGQAKQKQHFHRLCTALEKKTKQPHQWLEPIMHLMPRWKCTVLTGSFKNTTVTGDYVWTTRSPCKPPSPHHRPGFSLVTWRDAFVPEPQFREIGKSEVTFTFTTFLREVFPRVRPIYYIKMRYSLQRANFEGAHGRFMPSISD